MSLNHNSATVVGRLTRDIDLRALPSGQQIANVSIATNHVYTKDGEKKESTEFHEIVLFGKQAENASKYLHKGDEALVTGRLQTRSYEKDGVTHKRTEIIADSIQFGSKAPTPKVGNTDVDYHVPGETLPNGEVIPDPSGIPF